MFGGGKDKAKKYFEQAIARYDSFKVADPELPDWGYEEAYAWLGLTNIEFEEFEQAQTNYDKALEINPEYAWVQFHLIPKLKQKMAENSK
jgi:tetratricopeptide (TPR) repeat protein